MADKLIGQQQQQQMSVICGLPYRPTVTTFVVGTTLRTIVFIVTVISGCCWSCCSCWTCPIKVQCRARIWSCIIYNSIIDQADLYCLCWLASCELISYWLFAILSYIYRIYNYKKTLIYFYTTLVHQLFDFRQTNQFKKISFNINWYQLWWYCKLLCMHCTAIGGLCIAVADCDLFTTTTLIRTWPADNTKDIYNYI